jgi:hypothetical protein
LMRSCQPGPSAWKKSSTSRSMRSDTVSFAPGTEGGGAGCSAGLVVAVLNAASACERAAHCRGSCWQRRACPALLAALQGLVDT